MTLVPDRQDLEGLLELFYRLTENVRNSPTDVVQDLIDE